MVQIEDFKTQLHQRIAEAYVRSENVCGWRLLASPEAVLERADVAFIGVNPGGSIQLSAHGQFAMTVGSAYETEIWDRSEMPGMNPLQNQVRALFRQLSVEPKHVLAGNLVPFRSPSWKLLKNKKASLQFGETIWKDILNRAKPNLVIGMGREVFLPLSRILAATTPETVPVNWGNVSALKAKFQGGSLVILPHLSRFSIATRPESASALQVLFEDRWRTKDKMSF